MSVTRTHRILCTGASLGTPMLCDYFGVDLTPMERYQYFIPAIPFIAMLTGYSAPKTISKIFADISLPCCIGPDDKKDPFHRITLTWDEIVSSDKDVFLTRGGIYIATCLLCMAARRLHLGREKSAAITESLPDFFANDGRVIDVSYYLKMEAEIRVRFRLIWGVPEEQQQHISAGIDPRYRDTCTSVAFVVQAMSHPSPMCHEGTQTPLALLLFEHRFWTQQKVIINAAGRSAFHEIRLADAHARAMVEKECIRRRAAAAVQAEVAALEKQKRETADRNAARLIRELLAEEEAKERATEAAAAKRKKKKKREESKRKAEAAAAAAAVVQRKLDLASPLPLSNLNVEAAPFYPLEDDGLFSFEDATGYESGDSLVVFM